MPYLNREYICLLLVCMIISVSCNVSSDGNINGGTQLDSEVADTAPSDAELPPDNGPDNGPDAQVPQDSGAGVDVGGPHGEDVGPHGEDVGPYVPPDNPEWTVIPAPVVGRLNAVECKGGSVWAVGEDSTVLHAGPAGVFETQTVVQAVNLRSVAFLDETKGIAVGDALIVETSDGGTTWSPSWFCSVIPMETYHKVLIASEATGYAIGQSRSQEGTFKYRIPAGWNCFTAQTWPDYTLRTGAFSDDLTWFMAGDTDGNVLRSSNMHAWQTISTGVEAGFYGMAFGDENTGLLVGEGGAILRTDDGGYNWQQIPVDLQGETTLRSVALSGERFAVAVGDGGTIFQSTDRGQSFEQASSPTSATLHGVCLSGDTAYAVGDGGTILQKTF